MGYPIRVLFLCTHNAARSQIAEGLLRFFGQGDFAVFSAGSEPTAINPTVLQVMQELGIDISHQRSKSIDEFRGQRFDYVISLCETAREICPDFPDDELHIHWDYSDPDAVNGDEAERYDAIRKVVRELSERIKLWMLVQRKSLREQGIPFVSA